MSPELGWTKEMIDEIKDCEINNCFPIIINVQSNYYEFTDKEIDEKYNFAATSPISYEGIFSSLICYGDLDDFVSERYNVLGQVDISITFFDHNTRKFGTHKFEELSSETYKYGYLEFRNLKKGALIIGLNKECGIKETIDDLFIKSKIFNHKNLYMEINYDCEFVKDIEYENFFIDEHHINLVPIKSVNLEARFGLDQRPYVIDKE